MVGVVDSVGGDPGSFGGEVDIVRCRRGRKATRGRTEGKGDGVVQRCLR